MLVQTLTAAVSVYTCLFRRQTFSRHYCHNTATCCLELTCTWHWSLVFVSTSGGALITRNCTTQQCPLIFALKMDLKIKYPETRHCFVWLSWSSTMTKCQQWKKISHYYWLPGEGLHDGKHCSEINMSTFYQRNCKIIPSTQSQWHSEHSISRLLSFYQEELQLGTTASWLYWCICLHLISNTSCLRKSD